MDSTDLKLQLKVQLSFQSFKAHLALARLASRSALTRPIWPLFASWQLMAVDCNLHISKSSSVGGAGGLEKSAVEVFFEFLEKPWLQHPLPQHTNTDTHNHMSAPCPEVLWTPLRKRATERGRNQYSRTCPLAWLRTKRETHGPRDLRLSGEKKECASGSTRSRMRA